MAFGHGVCHSHRIKTRMTPVWIFMQTPSYWFMYAYIIHTLACTEHTHTLACAHTYLHAGTCTRTYTHSHTQASVNYLSILTTLHAEAAPPPRLFCKLSSFLSALMDSQALLLSICSLALPKPMPRAALPIPAILPQMFYLTVSSESSL